MSDLIDRVFVKAISTIRALSTRKSENSLPRPPLSNRVKLYGLYKQATEGDVIGIMERPIGNTPEIESNKRKWDAWEQEKGLSKEEAKVKYIEFLIETLKNYAIIDNYDGIDETKELLNELEYLWDQVKSSEDFNYNYSYMNNNNNQNHSSGNSFIGLSSNDIIQRSQSPALSLYRLASSNSNTNLLRPLSRLSMTHHSINNNNNQSNQSNQFLQNKSDLESIRTSLFNQDANVSKGSNSRRQFSNMTAIGSGSGSGHGNDLEFIKWQSDVNSTLSKLNIELNYLRNQRINGNNNNSAKSSFSSNNDNNKNNNNNRFKIIKKIQSLIINLLSTTFKFVKNVFKHLTVDIVIVYLTFGILKKFLGIDLINSLKTIKLNSTTTRQKTPSTINQIDVKTTSSSGILAGQESGNLILGILKTSEILINLIKLIINKSNSIITNNNHSQIVNSI